MQSDTVRYAPPAGTFDEVLAEDGSTRPAWRAVANSLGPLDPGMLLERRRQAERLLDAEGTGHLVHDLSLTEGRHAHIVSRESHPWHLDPLPFAVDGEEFDALARAAVQRMDALDAVLADLYGERRLLAAGVLRPADVFSLPSFRPAPGGPGRVRRWLVHYTVDVVRDAAGAWHVVADGCDAPVGVGYALLNRAVLARVLPEGLRAAAVAPVHEHADALRYSLAAAAPADRPSPRTVVLTPGPSSDSYVEHSYLATRLGHHLVEGADVVMREGRLWLRALDGLEPIDVVYRRIPDSGLDPLEAGHDGRGAGVPGIVWGATHGGVTLANAYGSAVAQEPVVGAALADAASFLTGEPLVMGRLAPGAALASAPVFDRTTGGLVPRAVVLRLHVVRHADGHHVMRGAAGRVLAPGDDPANPTSLTAKDVWVLGRSSSGWTRPFTVTAPPQVDFGGSVPTRVADSMYWLGRAAERAEVAARAVRVVSQQLEQDPGLVVAADGSWAAGVRALLRAARSAPHAEAQGEPAIALVSSELAAATTDVAGQLAALVQEAASVREYLSTTTGRVLGRLAAAQVRLSEPGAASDEIDSVLVDLAALSGLATESTVRGPAWRFLDLGRRLERALAVLGSIEAALGLAVPPFGLQPLAEALLAGNESLVAYRRRYRSDVDLGAVLDLLLRDDSNPRSVAYQLDRLREHTAGLVWGEGQQLVHDASTGAFTYVGDAVVNGRRLDVDALVLAVRGPLLELATAVARRWFADPVRPTVVRGR